MDDARWVRVNHLKDVADKAHGQKEESGLRALFPYSQQFHCLKGAYGIKILMAAILIDWPARKVAARVHLIPEHGSWHDAPPLVQALVLRAYGSRRQ